MEIEFKFNSKSSGQNVPEAIRLAQKLGGYLDKQYYKIKFASNEDDNLKTLYDLVGNLKGTEIIIGEEGPIVAHKFFRAVACIDKLLCKGICKHVRLGIHDLENFTMVNSENIKNGLLTISDPYVIREFSNFLEQTEENRFKLNKELILTYFEEETKMERRFCEKYNFSKIQDAIKELPNEIQLVAREQIKYEPEYGEEFEFENLVRTILTHCKLSSSLSFKDMLDCSKAISLLINKVGCVNIENTAIMMYSFPATNQIILAKVIADEDNFDEQEDAELEFIASKENEFFCVSNPSLRLYFQIFDEQDSTIESYYNKLKSLN